MSLFNKKRYVTALSDDAIASIKHELSDVLSVATSYDRMMMANPDRPVISLEGRIRGDLLAFVLYLSGVGKGVDLREILVVNQIFDIDLSHVDFEIFSHDVGSDSFEHAVPPSILILRELGNTMQREQMRTSDGSASSTFADEEGMSVLAHELCCDLINVYALIGSAFISADETVTERESGDLIRYLYMMTRALFGPQAELPEGAAQRTLAAHKRLFRRAPKVR